MMESNVDMGVAGGRVSVALAFTERDLPQFERIPAGVNGPDFSLIADESADFIELEGLGNWDDARVMAVLAETRRALRCGGTLRIATPDLDAVIHSYLFEWSRGLGSPTRGARFNAWLRSIQGVWHVYNEEDLMNLISKAGFVEMRRFVAGSGSEPALWNLEPVDASLIVIEARRPRCTVR
jgi:predicted SAM-dependent methyltransferase